MDLEETEASNDCAGEDHQQLNQRTDRVRGLNLAAVKLTTVQVTKLPL
jgi:hypothetical protein